MIIVITMHRYHIEDNQILTAYQWRFDSIFFKFLQVKLSSFFPKIIPKSTEMYTLYTNLLFFITFTMFHYIGQGYFVKLSHYK